MVKLAIDAMGGDFAPKEIVLGVNEALREHEDLEIYLYGDEVEINKYLDASSRVKVFNAPLALSMGVHDPIREIRRNPDLSLVQAFSAVHNKECDGAVTAGPTQGVVVAAHMVIKRIPGMKRIALCPVLPLVGGKTRLILDVGANTDLRSEHLLQFAHLASDYVAKTEGIEAPVVGLLNIGSEEGKGRDLEKELYPMLKNEEGINFFGNIEPKELFTSPCDIIVSDGFSGNMVIKSIEGTGKAVGMILKEEIKKSFSAKIGYLFMRKALANFKKRMSADEVGGALIFGVDGIVVKCHGSSNAHAFASGITRAYNAVKSHALDIMKEHIVPVEDNTNE